jgi:hypothetical protein
MERNSAPGANAGTLRLGAVVAIALLVAFLVWLLLIRDSDGDSGGDVSAGAPAQVATSDDLASLQDELGHPIYWVGERDDDQLELTRTKEDLVYVRYLPQGTVAGDDRPNFLTIGTYPVKDAFDVTTEAGTQKNAISTKTSDGGVVVQNSDTPNSVYVAYPGQDLQIEVYDPDPKEALDLATSGEVQPVG